MQSVYQRLKFLVSIVSFFAAFAPQVGVAAEHWEIQYQYKQLDSVLILNDIAFPSAQRGIACGFTTDRKAKERPFLIATSDGGVRWTEVPVKEACTSMFFRNDSDGWMVTARGLWFTAESGRSWTRLKGPAGLLKVWFQDRQHGFGVGLDKTVSETKDGGDTWTPLKVDGEISGDPKFTTFGEVNFQGQWGIISGWNIPPRRGGPDWMETERSSRRQWPNLSILLQTKDAGKSWTKSESSIFGQITRVDIGADGLGLGLIEFRDNFEYPSEIYGFNAKTGKTQRVYRESDRAITDLKQVPGSERVILAGFETTGTVFRSPIPGKLKILSSDDLTVWTEMEVDYRAVAHNAMIGAPDATHLWVATDTGMILKLIND